MQIGQQTAHRTEQKLLFFGNFLTGELLYSSLFCSLFQESPLPCPLGIGVQPVLCKGQNISAAVSAVRQQQLPGRKPSQLAHDFGLYMRAVQLSAEHLAGGNIAEAHTGTPGVQINRSDKVVAGLFQHGAFQHGAGGDFPDDLPAHQALGLCRIFHLLTDGNLVALGHQTGDIALGAVIGHTAHGCPLSLSAIPAGESQIQLPGHGFGVLKEHFVKVAQAIHQNAILVVIFHIQVLLHHGCKALFLDGFQGLFLTHFITFPNSATVEERSISTCTVCPIKSSLPQMCTSLKPSVRAVKS